MLVSAPEKAGLVELFAHSLGLPVEAINLADAFDISAIPALLNNDFVTEVLAAIGAALRQERRK
jgi:hypothetical protein